MNRDEWRRRITAHVAEARALAHERSYKLPSKKWATLSIGSTIVRGPGAAPDGDLVPRILVDVCTAGGIPAPLTTLNSDDLARLAGIRGEYERWLSGQRDDLPTEDNA